MNYPGDEKDTDVKKIRITLKRLAYILIGIIGLLAIAVYAFFFVSDRIFGLSNCPYRENIMPMPESLKGAALELDTDFVLMRGKDPEVAPRYLAKSITQSG